MHFVLIVPLCFVFFFLLLWCFLCFCLSFFSVLIFCMGLIAWNKMMDGWIDFLESSKVIYFRQHCRLEYSHIHFRPWSHCHVEVPYLSVDCFNLFVNSLCAFYSLASLTSSGSNLPTSEWEHLTCVLCIYMKALHYALVPPGCNRPTMSVTSLSQYTIIFH